MTMNPLEDPTNNSTPSAQPEKTAVEAALERVAAAAGSNYDRSQMDELKAKLAKLGKSDQKTTSGSEAPTNGTPEAAPDTRPLTGRDVDWSEYNLDFNVAHLYPKAVYRPTPQGPKWVAMVIDFHSTQRDFRNHGKKVNAPGSNDKAQTEALNLGEYLNDMVNGREQWHIEAIMPTGMQCGVLLSRQVPIILPDPQPLKKEEEVAAPTDPQLQQVEDAALAFAASEGTPVEESLDTEAEVGDYPSAATPDAGLRAIERGSDEHAAIVESLEQGAVQARHGAGVERAIATAAPETLPAPTAGVEQPEAITGNDLAVSNANPEGKVAAGGYSAAQDLLRALNDPNFRASLPQEE